MEFGESIGIKASLDDISLIPALKGLDADQLGILQNYIHQQELSSGEILFRENEPGDYMGFVVEGDLEVLKESMSGRQSGLAVISKGEAFGEIAIVDRKPRSATMRSQSTSRILTLSADDIDRLADIEPLIVIEIMREISRTTAQRLRRASNRLADMI